MTTQEAPETEAQEKENAWTSIMVNVPADFKDMVKQSAESGDESVNAFVRRHLASIIGYTGKLERETRRRRKYASEQERQAAQKARAKAKREVIKDLLEKYGDETKEALEQAEEQAVAEALAKAKTDESDD